MRYLSTFFALCSIAGYWISVLYVRHPYNLPLCAFFAISTFAHIYVAIKEN